LRVEEIGKEVVHTYKLLASMTVTNTPTNNCDFSKRDFILINVIYITLDQSEEQAQPIVRDS
jgi:hypothetical protein